MNDVESKRIGFAHDNDVEGGKEEWLTPPYILNALGPFDLDPCAPINRPWEIAARHYTAQDNGLMKPWEGFVWCNPPYGKKTGEWMRRAGEHGNTLVLIFVRTETEAFQRWIWPVADGLFFLKGRVSFHHVTGEKASAAGAPSVLVAFGADAVKRCAEQPRAWRTFPFQYERREGRGVSVMNRHTIAAKKMRVALLEKLGAWCVLCGEDDPDELQFDHKIGRAYLPHKLSYKHRMTVYTREAANGLIRVLCADCNLAERKKNDNGRFVPTACDVPLTNNIPF